MSESKLSLTTLAPMLSVRAVKVVIPLDPHELSSLAAPEGEPRRCCASWSRTFESRMTGWR
jgi:hypothetical protein